MEAASTTQTAFSPTLPEELWVGIFSFLPDLRELPKVALVCRQWHRMVAESAIWRNIHCHTYSTGMEWVGPAPNEWRRQASTVFSFTRNYWKGKTEDANTWGTLGTRLYKNGHINEATSILFQNKLFKKNDVANTGRSCSLANILLKLQRFEEAHDVLNRLFLSHQNVKALAIQGNIYQEEEEFEKAKLSYKASINLATDDESTIEAKLGLLQLWKSLKNEAKFKKTQEKLGHLGGDLPNKALEARYIALTFKHLSHISAKQAYEANLQPDHMAYLIALSMLHKAKETVNYYQEKSLDPLFRSYPTMNSLNLDSIQSWFDKSIKSNPYHIKVLFSFIKFLEFTIQTRCQIDSLFSQIKLNEKREEMRGILIQVIQLNPKLAKAYYLLGKVLYLLKDHKASQSLEKAQEMGYQTKELNEYLMKTYLSEKQFNNAEKVYQKMPPSDISYELKFLYCEVIFEEAQTALNFKSDKVNEAQTLLNELLAENPNDVDCLLFLTQIFEKQDNFTQATDVYKKVCELMKDKKNEPTRLLEITLDKNLISYGASDALWQKQIKNIQIKNLGQADMGIIRCLDLQGKRDASISHLLEIINHFLFEHEYGIAKEMLEYHDNPTKEVLLKRGDLFKYQWRGACSYKQSNPEFPGIESDQNIQERAHFYWGGSYDQFEEKTKELVDTCEQTIRKAIELDPAHIPSWAALASFYDDMHILEKAIEAIDQVLILNPNNFHAIHYLSALILDHKKPELYKKAIDLLQSGIESLKRMNKEELEEICSSNLNDAPYVLSGELLRLFYQTDSIAQAEMTFIDYFCFLKLNTYGLNGWRIKAGELSPCIDRQEALDRIGYSTGEYGEFFLVLRDQTLPFQKRVCSGVLGRDPENFLMLCLMGQFLYQEGQKDSAAYHWEKALNLKPGHDLEFEKDLLSLLYDLFLSLDKRSEAKAIAYKAMDLMLRFSIDTTFLNKLADNHPEDFLIQYNIGAYYFFEKEFQKAKELLTKALAINEEHLKTHYLIFLTYHFLKLKEKAQRHKMRIEELLSKDPDRTLNLVQRLVETFNSPDMKGSSIFDYPGISMHNFIETNNEEK
ncbi:MAG: Beta-barrel assembly-enhancing protease [Chlamydiae bacterium]|nr:Beta-barrel assembly-enhancing protease [Chlamydiota bacterium]